VKHAVRLTVDQEKTPDAVPALSTEAVGPSFAVRPQVRAVDCSPGSLVIDDLSAKVLAVGLDWHWVIIDLRTACGTYAHTVSSPGHQSGRRPSHGPGLKTVGVAWT
jgi:hypothetical protein